MPNVPVIGVLLAAGGGRRLGRGPKALLSFDSRSNGAPQVARMTNALLHGGCDEVIVVVGASGDQVRHVLQQSAVQGRYRIVENEVWETGMGSSFRVGVDAGGQQLAAHPGGLLLIALADQPDVDEAVVSHVLKRASSHRVTAAGFRDSSGRVRRGRPIVFPLTMAQEAAALAVGDVAGRTWLRAHPDSVDVIDVGHLATGMDIDTPSDLEDWTLRREQQGRFDGAS